MTNPIFCALDTTDTASAAALARDLAPHIGGIKLGLEFFNANGLTGVERVQKEAGLPLFLDLKFHDIPNTVAGSTGAVMRLNPDLLTIHAAGGTEMMKAAVAVARDLGQTKVIAVTVLTSLDQQGLSETGVAGSLADQVLRLAALARQAGCDGIVCSAHEAAQLRAELGPDFLLVVPGIRPSWAEAGDQKRILTPAQALARGASYLVIGRPITAATDPVAAARRIAGELNEA